jgi:hypothetical protein
MSATKTTRSSASVEAEGSISAEGLRRKPTWGDDKMDQVRGRGCSRSAQSLRKKKTEKNQKPRPEVELTKRLAPRRIRRIPEPMTQEASKTWKGANKRGPVKPKLNFKWLAIR